MKRLIAALTCVLVIGAQTVVFAEDVSITTVTTTTDNPLTHATETQQEITTTEMVSKTDRIVAIAALNVRSGPGTNYSVLGSLKKGNVVNVLEQIGSWYKITYNGGVAYVYAPYVASRTTQTPETTTKTVTTVTYATKTVNTALLNVRTGPGTSYPVVGHLEKGEAIPVLSQQGGWSKIQFHDGVGYVSAQYLK